MKKQVFSFWIFFVLVQFVSVAAYLPFKSKHATESQIKKPSENTDKKDLVIKASLPQHVQVVRFQLLSPIFHLLYRVETQSVHFCSKEVIFHPVNVFLRVLFTRIIPNKAP